MAAYDAAPLVSAVDTKHMRGEFTRNVNSTATGTACHEDHLRFDEELVKSHGRYLTRTSDCPTDTPWTEALVSNGKMSIQLSVKPAPTNLSKRLRRRVVTFTAILGAGQARPPSVSVLLSPAECNKAFFAGCSACPAHIFVPLSIGLSSYRITGKDVNTSFSVQLETAWMDFSSDDGKGAKLKPRRWFGTESCEAIRDLGFDKTTVIGNGPQIGIAAQVQEYRRPRPLYTADERFVTPENIDTIAVLAAAGKAPEDFGAVRIEGRTDQMLLRKPSIKSTTFNVAPSILSLKYTAEFARRFRGASAQTIEEHSRNSVGIQTRTEEDKYWLCETNMLQKLIHQVRAEFTEECLSMNLREGITVTFYPDDPYGWRQPGAAIAAVAAAPAPLPAAAAAAGAGGTAVASTGRCVLSVTFVVTGIVV